MNDQNIIPVIDSEHKDFRKQLEFNIWSTQSCTDFRNDRERPYDGQPWTDEGERGKQEVYGITMRDIADCFIKAFLICCQNEETRKKVEDGTWRYQDVYKAYKNDPDFDPLAVQKALTVEIEKMMGIYPNISALCPTAKEILQDIEQRR